MPYKDPEKQKEARKRLREKAKAEKAAAEQTVGVTDVQLPPGEGIPVDFMHQLADMGEAEQDALDGGIFERCKGQSGAVWAFVFYPDSAPDNWEDLLRLSGHIVAVSPLHDKDKKKDGTLKKPHYHAIIAKRDGGKYTFNTARAVSKGMLHGTIPILLSSPRGYYRYFCHLDNPDKAQYPESQIIRINGFDPADFLDLSRAEEMEIRKKLTHQMYEMGITDYGTLVCLIMEEGSNDEFYVVSRNTVYFREIAKSVWYANGGNRKDT